MWPFWRKPPAFKVSGLCSFEPSALLSATTPFFLHRAAMASALPSQAVIKAWNEGEGAPLQTVLPWARVVGPLAEAFLRALDSTADGPYKSLMLISEGEAAEITNNVTIGEAKPGPLQLAKIRLVFASVWHAAQGGHPAPGQGAAIGPALPDPPPPT